MFPDKRGMITGLPWQDLALALLSLRRSRSG